jgi:hypothetical protein
MPTVRCATAKRAFEHIEMAPAFYGADTYRARIEKTRFEIGFHR